MTKAQIIRNLLANTTPTAAADLKAGDVIVGAKTGTPQRIAGIVRSGGVIAVSIAGQKARRSFAPTDEVLVRNEG